IAEWGWLVESFSEHSFRSWRILGTHRFQRAIVISRSSIEGSTLEAMRTQGIASVASRLSVVSGLVKRSPFLRKLDSYLRRFLSSTTREIGRASCRERGERL